MRNLKRSLQQEIRNGTSFFEIIDENIDVYARAYAAKHKTKAKLMKRKIIHIVIDHLNNNLGRL